MVMVAMPLASVAVVLTDKLPFVGIVDPSVGVVMVTTGGVVSFGCGVGTGVDVGATVAVGVTPMVGAGVGVGVGFTIMELPTVVTVNTVVSTATSCVTAEVKDADAVALEVVVLAPNWRVASWNVPDGVAPVSFGSSPTTKSIFPAVLAAAMVVCLMTLPQADVVRAGSAVSFTTAGSNVIWTVKNASGLSVVAHNCSVPLGGRESVAGRRDTFA